MPAIAFPAGFVDKPDLLAAYCIFFPYRATPNVLGWLDPAADALLNDLDVYLHAFVIACLMDRQIQAERAWLVPYSISTRLGGFAIETLSELTHHDFVEVMTKPLPVHRLIKVMPDAVHAAVQRIAKDYSGDAALIWKGRPSSAEVVYRFLEFKGAGPKIATMVANLLARDFKVQFSDYFSIDISADVHVRRVFARLGLVPADPSAEQVIYKARALHPTFPGIMDLSCWEIGRAWCGTHERKCTLCHMNDVCPSALSLLGIGNPRPTTGG